MCWETGDIVCECEKRKRKGGGRGEQEESCAELSVSSFLGCSFLTQSHLSPAPNGS